MKNNENVILGQKVVFCGPKKTMMLTESDRDFFTRDIRVVRSSIAGSFSLAGEGHRKRGRFPVELPCSPQRPISVHISIEWRLTRVVHSTSNNCHRAINQRQQLLRQLPLPKVWILP
jgi:hypothetical protein